MRKSLQVLGLKNEAFPPTRFTGGLRTCSLTAVFPNLGHCELLCAECGIVISCLGALVLAQQCSGEVTMISDSRGWKIRPTEFSPFELYIGSAHRTVVRSS